MEIVESFLLSQDVKPASRELYRRTFRQYVNWLAENNYTLTTVNQTIVLKYKEYLQKKAMSSLTVGSYLCPVRKFYDWAEREGICANIAKRLRSPKRRQQFRKHPLAKEQAKKLIQYAEVQSIRDFALINLLIRTGLRTIEVARANTSDIVSRGGKRILLVQGKGRDEKDSFVVLTDKTYEPIERYLATRLLTRSEEPLFVSESPNSQNERLTTRSISAISKRALQAIGLNGKEFTAHSLRHTTAVNILRAGGSLQDAQGVLRHRNPATTQIYTGFIEEEMRLENSAESLIDNIL